MGIGGLDPSIDGVRKAIEANEAMRKKMSADMAPPLRETMKPDFNEMMEGLKKGNPEAYEKLKALLMEAMKGKIQP